MDPNVPELIIDPKVQPFLPYPYPPGFIANPNYPHMIPNPDYPKYIYLGRDQGELHQRLISWPMVEIIGQATHHTAPLPIIEIEVLRFVQEIPTTGDALLAVNYSADRQNEGLSSEVAGSANRVRTALGERGGSMSSSGFGTDSGVPLLTTSAETPAEAALDNTVMGTLVIF